ncbi:MAG TPA: hypothetical protein VNF26_02370 [Candidatus Baltobacterales bacterium]|nr:hypothetical protein [Candidatus Baltobacterales bacterium]
MSDRLEQNRPSARRIVFVGALVIAFAAAWFGAGFLPIVPTDLDIFFWPSAQAALAGHPLAAYSQTPPDQYPNVNQNGPVLLVPLTLIGALVQALGLMQTLYPRRAITLAFFSLFILLMAREGVAAIERLRGNKLAGGWRLLAYGALAAGPPVWQSLAGYGHIEQPFEVWFVLLAIRWLDAGWPARSGTALGLAVLSRSIAGLYAVPLALHAWRQRPMAIPLMAIAAAATALLGLLPFYLADPASLMQSLFTNRGLLIVGAGSIWTLSTGTVFEQVAQHDDVVFVALLALATNVCLATRPGGLTAQRLFAAVTLTAASFMLLTKTVWPYYLMEIYVFATVWAAGTWRAKYGWQRLVLPPVVIAALGALAEFGSTPHLARDAVMLESVAMFVVLGAFFVWLLTAASGQPARSSISRV